MRAAMLLLLAMTALSTACDADFALGDRCFQCTAGTGSCGDGYACVQGCCRAGVEADAAPPDGRADAPPGTESCANGTDDDDDGDIDCQDADCGVASCMDTTVCTDDICQAGGMCAHINNSNSCGAGCSCNAGAKHESGAGCTDTVDNDGDMLNGCLDVADCPACGALMCCSDGLCKAVCT